MHKQLCHLTILRFHPCFWPSPSDSQTTFVSLVRRRPHQPVTGRDRSLLMLPLSKRCFFFPNRVYDQKSTSRSTALRKSYLKSTSVLSYSYLLLNADFFFPDKLNSIFNLFIFFLPTREQQKHSQWVSAAELQMGLINKRPTGT